MLAPKNYTYSLRQEDNVFRFLTQDITKLSPKGKIILLGDFNSRTSTSLDYISNDDDNYAVDRNVYNYYV